MANEEQLSILKQGVKTWNKWRDENPRVRIDLSEADLSNAHYSEIYLENADLKGATLINAVFQDANLSRADMRAAELGGANFTNANLHSSDIGGANLMNTELRGANLQLASFGRAYLRNTTLRRRELRLTNLHNITMATDNFGKYIKFDYAVSEECTLRGANFSDVEFGNTIFGVSDLSEIHGLEKTIHLAPSIMPMGTFVLSKGKIPTVFLRGCGLSDWEIEEVGLYNPNLSNEQVNKILQKIYELRATQALQISPLFISYSHADSEFINKLDNQLNAKGIRFWRDIHEMKAGRIEKQIDQAISQNRTVLLILSEHSLSSDWVEHEVRTARELEKVMGRDVLCPIALDDSWKSSPWPKRVMEQIMEYNILDFSAWKDDVKFEGMFRKLIDGLQLFYKDKSHGE